jgi:hypothetical protein
VLQVVYAWLGRAAHILGADGPGTAAGARRPVGGLLGAMRRHRARAGALAWAVGHFRKVSRRYGPGLFHGDAVADLPRTNNDLEHCFGGHRYHERRASGRKAAAPGLVLRGAAPGGRRDAATHRHRGSVSRRGPAPACRAAAAVGGPAPAARPTEPLPPRPANLPTKAGGPTPPASIAALVFFGVRQTVAGSIASTTASAMSLSASNCLVQRACPAGGGEHFKAIRRASWAPSSLRYCR